MLRYMLDMLMTDMHTSLAGVFLRRFNRASLERLIRCIVGRRDCTTTAAKEDGNGSLSPLCGGSRLPGRSGIALREDSRRTEVRGNAIGANAKWPRSFQAVLSASSSTCYFSLRHQQRNIVSLLAGSELLYGRND